jgi:hypothetical protein
MLLNVYGEWGGGNNIFTVSSCLKRSVFIGLPVGFVY